MDNREQPALSIGITSRSFHDGDGAGRGIEMTLRPAAKPLTECYGLRNGRHGRVKHDVSLDNLNTLQFTGWNRKRMATSQRSLGNDCPYLQGAIKVTLREEEGNVRLWASPMFDSWRV